MNHCQGGTGHPRQPCPCPGVLRTPEGPAVSSVLRSGAGPPTLNTGRFGWLELLSRDSLEKAQEEEPAPPPAPAPAGRAVVTCFSAGQPAACLRVSPAGQTRSPESVLQAAPCSPWAVVSTFSGTFGQKGAHPLHFPPHQPLSPRPRWRRHLRSSAGQESIRPERSSASLAPGVWRQRFWVNRGRFPETAKLVLMGGARGGLAAGGSQGQVGSCPHLLQQREWLSLQSPVSCRRGYGQLKHRDTVQVATLSLSRVHGSLGAGSCATVRHGQRPPALASGPASCEWPVSACWELQERGCE